MDVHSRYRLARVWLPRIGASALIAGIVAFAIASVQPSVYESQVTMVVGPPQSGRSLDYNQLLAAQQLSETYATIASTRPVLLPVIEELELPDTPARLQRRVTAASASDSPILSVTVRDADPLQAAAIANAIARRLEEDAAATASGDAFQQSIQDELEAIRAEIRVTQAEIEVLRGAPDRTAAEEDELQALLDRIVSLRSTFATLVPFSSSEGSTDLLTVIQPAVAADVPSGPRPLLTGMLAAMAALIVASAVALIIESASDTIRDADVIHEIGLQILGAIPRADHDRHRRTGQLPTLATHPTPTTDAYRALRTNIELENGNAVGCSILVTSAEGGVTRTVVAANLAVVFAQGGRRVLLVDADISTPSAHEVLGLPNNRGLTSIASAERFDVRALVQKTQQDHLDLLSSGQAAVRSSRSDLFGYGRTGRLVSSLVAQYDVTVLIGPPLKRSMDSAVLSSSVDVTLVVVGLGRSSSETVRSAHGALLRAHARTVGIVLVGA